MDATDERRRLLLLALALGPCSSSAALLSAEKDGERCLASWLGHGEAYAFWQGARGPEELLERCRVQVCALERLGGRLLLATDPDYPQAITRLPRAPAALFLQGVLPAGELVAVVGARAAPLPAMALARELAAGLSAHGLGVVSGGALGVDAAAHEGALAGGEGTVAVLGSGLDRPYPGRNRELFLHIARAGALVSSYPLGTPPRRGNFPGRNRIIAAWSRGVVVVYAGRHSGALHTAGWAVRLRLPLMAVPGSPGCNGLLASGRAAAIRTDAEVAAVLRGEVAGRQLPAWPEDPQQRRLLGCLGAKVLDVDELAMALGWSVSRTAALLIRLELDGWIVSLPGGQYRVMEGPGRTML